MGLGSRLVPIVSFYSFKGGVGRTFVALETAAQLAHRGYRVCVWDLDLEAPTLHRHAQLSAAAQDIPLGTLDLFERADASGAVASSLVSEALVKVRTRGKTNLSFLFPASSTSLAAYERSEDSGSGDYATRYWQRDWQRDFEDGRGVNMFLSLGDELARRFDVVIVDSRTGLTDVGYLCTNVLADAVVLVFALSDQNLEGLRRAFSAVTRRTGSMQPPPTFMVANLVPDEISRSSNPRLREGYDQQASALRQLALVPDIELPMVPARLVDDVIPSLRGGDELEGKPFLRLVDWIETTTELGPLTVRQVVRQTHRHETEAVALFGVLGWHPVVGEESPRSVDAVLERSEGEDGRRLVLVVCEAASATDVEQLHAARTEIDHGTKRRHEAALVSQLPPSNAARSRAQELDVTVVTPSEVVRSQLEPLLAPGAARVTAATTSGLVELTGSVEDGRQIAPLNTLIERWLETRNSLLVVSGSPGSGKTTALNRLASSMATRVMHDTSPTDRARWPVTIRMRDVVPDAPTLDELFSRASDGAAHRVAPRTLRMLHQLGWIVLFLDGLDEIANPTQMWELIDEACGPTSKVVVSTRSADSLPARLRARATTVRIEPLARSEVARYARFELGSDADEFVSSLTSVPTAASFLESPMLLRLAINYHRLFGELPTTLHELLERHTRNLVGDEAGSEGNQYWALASELAWRAWQRGDWTLPTTEVIRVAAALAPDRPMDAVERLLGRSWILEEIRPGTVAFAHQLVFEFFVADALSLALANGDTVRFRIPRLSEGVVEHLRASSNGELELADRHLGSAIRTAGADPSLAVNAVVVLHALGCRLDNARLAGLDLSDVRLDGADLRAADLRGADLRVAHMANADLRKADLSNANLTGATLTGANLEGAALMGAALDGADLSNALGEWRGPGGSLRVAVSRGPKGWEVRSASDILLTTKSKSAAVKGARAAIRDGVRPAMLTVYDSSGRIQQRDQFD